jgi:type IX secretion system PorP/SprF family membrane protein
MRKVLLSFAFVAASAVAYAQDPVFSQYFNTPMLTNPALTGMFNGNVRIGADYRNQWGQINNAFETGTVAIDARLKGFNIGGVVMSQKAGTASYQKTTALASGSYNVFRKKTPNHNLMIGVQAGIIQHSIDQNNLSFGSQYIPGLGFDPSNPAGENILVDQKTMFDLNAGVLWFMGNTSRKWNPFAGFSAYHLTKPNTSFTTINTELPTKWILHGGTRVNLNEHWALTPNAQLMWQEKATNHMIGLNAHYRFLSTKSVLTGGLMYRLEDAIVPYIALDLGNMSFGFSYDYNTSDLSNVQNTKGTYEVSIIYIFPNSKTETTPVCPRL